MLQVKEILRPVGIGVTAPWLVRASDDQIYIVKTMANQLGPQILLNEYFAGKLGELLQLPLPKVQLITGLKIYGPHVGILYLPHGHYVQSRYFSQTLNLPELAGLILFDHFFHNWDRVQNRRNLLACREGQNYRIYGIDHSHLFIKGKWNEEKLAHMVKSHHLFATGPYRTLLKHYLRPQHFAVYAEAFGQIQTSQVESILAEIPEPWQIREAKKTALVSYWNARQTELPRLLEKLCALIPNVNRGSQMDQNE